MLDGEIGSRTMVKGLVSSAPLRPVITYPGDRKGGKRKKGKIDARDTDGKTSAARHALSSSGSDLYCTERWSRPQPDFRRLTPRRFPKFRHGIPSESLALAKLIHRFYFEEEVVRSCRGILILELVYLLENFEKLIFFSQH